MKALVQQDYYSYDTLIESFEHEVLLEKEDDDYQGDSYFLFRDGSHHGFLVFGWGSCSGCDALQGCDENLEEVTQLRDQLYQSIQWFDTADALLFYLLNNDWEVKFYGRKEAFRQFLNEAIALLGGKQVHLCEDCGKKIEQAGKCDQCDQEEREYRQREVVKAQRKMEKRAELDKAEREYRDALAAMSLVTGPGWAPISLSRLPNLEQSLRKLVDLVSYVEGNE